MEEQVEFIHKRVDAYESPSMKLLKTTARILCVIPFLTGGADLINGVGLLSFAGAKLGVAAKDATLHSQVSFWGAIWFGFGVILWRSSSHLRDEPTLFRLLCGILVLSGLARVPPGLVFGLPPLPLSLAMPIEIISGLALLLWHRSAYGAEQERHMKRRSPLPANWGGRTLGTSNSQT